MQKAEYCIVNANLIKASDFYSKAFVNKKEPFVNDIRNSIICEINSRKDESIIKYRFILFLKISGLKIEDIEFSNTPSSFVNILPTELLSIKNWNKVEVLAKDIKYNINDSLRKLLIRVCNNDQETRRFCFKKYGNPYHSSCINKIKEADIQNKKILIRLMSNKKISESIVGYKGFGCIYYVAQHNLMWGDDSLINLLYDYTIKGYYDSRIYSELKDVAYSFNASDKAIEGLYGTFMGGIFGDYYVIFLLEDKRREKKVDNNRHLIYLTPIIHTNKFQLSIF